MPKVTGIIEDGTPNYINANELWLWFARHEGMWYESTFKILGGKKDPKTTEQLGYYWGLLLPQILLQLIDDGHTASLTAFGITHEVPINQAAAHELLTVFCGLVGEGGASIRLSAMDKYQAVKFVDNVLEFAIADLGMNGPQLKALRKKSKG